MTWEKYVNVQVGERNWEGKRNHPSAVKGKQDWVTRREERKKKKIYILHHYIRWKQFLLEGIS